MFGNPVSSVMSSAATAIYSRNSVAAETDRLLEGVLGESSCVG